jgi:ectoine hydrolase
MSAPPRPDPGRSGRAGGRGWRGRIEVEVEVDNCYFSTMTMEKLITALPGANCIKLTGLVNWQRAVKSPEAISFTHKAIRISEKIVDGLIERVEP